MNKIIQLSKCEKLGQAYKTPCGLVNICVQGTTLHFTEDAFINYAAMISAARARLIEQGLQQIIEGAQDGNGD